MSATEPAPSGRGRRVAVVGATGRVGQAVCQALAAAGVPVTALARDEGRLAALAQACGGDVRTGVIADPTAFGGVLEDVGVVAVCQGAIGRHGPAWVEAALAHGADYLDVSPEPHWHRDALERFDAPARRAGRTVVPGVGWMGAMGDWAATWAAEAVTADDPPDTVDPRARRHEAYPLDRIDVAFALEGWLATPGAIATARSLLEAGALAWQDERWIDVPIGARHDVVNFGGVFGPTRTAVLFPSAEVITVPRQVACRQVRTRLAPSRHRWMVDAMRGLSWLVPQLGRRGMAKSIEASAAWWLGPATADEPADAALAPPRAALVARAERGFARAHVRVGDADPYVITAAALAWAAQAWTHTPPTVAGVITPSQAWPAQLALPAIARAHGLTVDTSF